MFLLRPNSKSRVIFATKFVAVFTACERPLAEVFCITTSFEPTFGNITQIKFYVQANFVVKYAVILTLFTLRKKPPLYQQSLLYEIK